jgi:glutathione S-transferase
LKIKLYWCIVSACNRALKSLMIHGNVNNEDIYVDMLKGEHKSEECLKYNPDGTIPFLVVNGKCLKESASLLRFIANAFPGLNYLYPEDFFVRHTIDAALDFNGT